MKRFLSICLVVVTLFSAMALYVEGQDTAEQFPMDSWMAGLPDDASLGQINLAGTHDSATYRVGLSKEILRPFWKMMGSYVPKPLWVPALVLAVPLLTAVLLPMAFRLPGLVRQALDGLGQCVDMDIPTQLSSGLRAFDLRLSYNWREFPEAPDAAITEGADRLDEITKRLRMMHGSVADVDTFLPFVDHDIPLAAALDADDTPLTLQNVLADCQNFLKQSPDETVILFYKNEGSIDERISDSAYNRTVEALEKYVQTVEDDNLLLLRDGDTLPTVGEARGKIYLVFSDDCYLIENAWDVCAEEKIQRVRELFADSEQLPQDYTGTFRMLSCPDENAPRVLYTSTYYDMGPNIKNIFFGGAPIHGTPRELAAEINRFVENYAFRPGQYYGWIMMNYPTENEIRRIIQSNIFA